MDYYEKILENHNCRLIEKDGCYITWKIQKELYLQTTKL